MNIECNYAEDFVFDPETKTIVIVGRTKSGKSTLLKYFTQKLKETLGITHVFIFTGTHGLNPIYNDWSKYVYPLSMGRVKGLIQLQSELAERAQKNPNMLFPKILVIVDDFVGAISFRKKEVYESFNLLATQGRYRGIVTAYVAHKYTALTDIVREAAEYILVTKIGKNCILDGKIGIFGAQEDYDKPDDFFQDYNKYTKEKYSFMCVQKIDPYDKSVSFYHKLGFPRPVKSTRECIALHTLSGSVINTKIQQSTENSDQGENSIHLQSEDIIVR